CRSNRIEVAVDSRFATIFSSLKSHKGANCNAPTWPSSSAICSLEWVYAQSPKHKVRGALVGRLKTLKTQLSREQTSRSGIPRQPTGVQCKPMTRETTPFFNFPRRVTK